MLLIIGAAAQGKTEYARTRCIDQTPFFDDYHWKIREALLRGTDPEQEARALLSACPNAVIVMNEVGSGIIPVDPVERSYREMVGRIGCLFASAADEVVRIILGTPVRIK